MLNRNEVEKVLKTAKSIDKDFEIFGASKHKYQLNPVTTIEKVQEFEKKYGMQLPEEYVSFLTKVGNGGAGPDYGLYSLEMVETMNSRWLNQDSRPPFIDKALTAEKWKAVMDGLDDDEYDDDEYDGVMDDVYSGILVIGTQGCTFDTLLMCKGSERGKIVYIDWNLEGDYPPYLTDMEFEYWYMGYFKELQAGNSLHSYGHYYLENEKELINHYYNTDIIEQKKKCVSSMERLKEISNDTINFLLGIEYKEIDTVRLYLLMKYSSENGMRVFEKLLMGENKKAAVSCARRMPDEKYDMYYEPMLKLLYEENDVDKRELLFFLDHCSCCLAGDLAEYVMNTKNPIETRMTAVYVMGECEDALKYEKEFIILMKDKSYLMAQRALQSSIHVGFDSEEIKECYRWMAKQYAGESNYINSIKNLLKCCNIDFYHKS